MFKDYFIESTDIVQIEAFKGFIGFSKEDIQDILDNPSDYAGSDNIPKWFGHAIRDTWYKKKKISKQPQIDKITKGILNDILKGKIKKVEFERDENKNIRGFKNIKATDYL